MQHSSTLLQVVQGAQCVLLLALLLAASVWDCRYRRIPNWLTLSGAAAGVLLALVLYLAGLGREGRECADLARGSMAGMVLAGGAMLLFYLGGGFGGGDVKLSLGVGALSGYPAVVNYMFYSLLAALAIMLGRLTWHGELRRGIRAALSSRTGVLDPGGAARESGKENPDRVFASFSPAWLLGVLWVWIMSIF